MNFEPVSKKALFVWEIFSAVLFGLLFVLALFIFYPGTWLWYFLLWLLGGMYLFTALLYVPWYYVNFDFGINDETIVCHKGVFFHRTQVLYRDRIAFVSVYNNPLTPLLKLSSLLVNAAGGRIHIPWIPTPRAKELADMLSKRGGGLPS